MKMRFIWSFVFLILVGTAAVSFNAEATGRGMGNSSGIIMVPAGNGRFIPQGVGPYLYDPNYTLYDWEINNNPYSTPCYYDERYGQWVGPCNISLDQPGFSITVPNRIRR
jgi:hypothetical protein